MAVLRRDMRDGLQSSKGFRALARRPTGRRGWFLSALGGLAVLMPAGLAAGVVDLPSDSGAQAEPGARASAPEPQLDGEVSAGGSRDQGPQSRGGPRPTVVQVRPPGGFTEEQAAGEGTEAPPRRVLEENAKLRGQLDHLKALEAERRRVSRTLVNSGATYDGPVRLGPGGLAWPVGGPVVSPFGQRWGRLHAGIDIAARAGTVIHAAEAGRVAISGPTGGYGNYVCVQHTTQLTSCYAHLSRFLTRRGAAVAQGEPIGLVGCTGHCFGDHLHFETWVGGRPVDPMGYF